jgi:ABC-type transport system substrate-binding protein
MLRLWRWVSNLAALERRIFLAGAALTIIGLGALSVRTWKAATVSIPVSGGTLVEGFVGTRTELDQTVEQLTKAGLVYRDVDGSFKPLLTESWEIKDSGKTYIFHLRPGVLSSGIVDATKDRTDLFETIAIEAPDDQTLIFRLKQPFGPFLSILSLPLFPGGPFQITGQVGEQVTFIRNETFAPGAPYLEKISIRIFPNEMDLAKAVSRGEVSMASPRVSDLQEFQTFTVFLPRLHAVFMNVAKEPFSDSGIRSKIARKEKFGEPLSVTITTSVNEKERAEKVAGEWRGLGVNVDLSVVDEVTLRQTIIPDRNYQVLVYGLDSGVDPDPYRFWYSSQAKKSGLNLTNLKDSELDRLLDDARRTIDEGARKEKYSEIAGKIADKNAMIILEEVTFPFQVDRHIKGARDVLQGVDVGSRYSQVWTWYIKERRVLKK